jgi:hypothetical protein
MLKKTMNSKKKEEEEKRKKEKGKDYIKGVGRYCSVLIKLFHE